MQGLQGAISQQVTSKWLNTQSTFLSSSLFYDEAGKAQTLVDPSGNITQITYDANDLFPASVTGPATNGVAHVEHYSYDENTGNVIYRTDENGAANDPNHSTNFTYDAAGRISDILLPATALGRGEIKYCYADYRDPSLGQGTPCAGGSIPNTVYTTKTASPSPSIVASQSFDGLGRSISKALLSDPISPIVTDTTYDGVGNVHSVTNPYRITPIAGDPASGVTTIIYDALGRKTSIILPDSSTEYWCYDGVATSTSNNCLGNQSSYSVGTWVDIQDEAGGRSQQVSDAEGRLRAVMEQNPTGTNLALETDYGYDVLNNLTSVNQLGVPSEAPSSRSFTYDSLSRLVMSINPETGLTCYGSGDTTVTDCPNDGYDANGNVLVKTDANGTATRYTYDALNRMLTKTANAAGGTPFQTLFTIRAQMALEECIKKPVRTALMERAFPTTRWER